MTILDVCDELAEAIEPDALLRDDARAKPAEYEPDRLYVWPASEVYVIEATGDWDQEIATLRVAWVTDASQEQAAGTRDRAITDLIVDRVDAIGALIRNGHRSGATYENADLTRVDYESLTTLENRGFIADLTVRASRSD